MIRQVKHNDKNYFVVHTDMHIVDDVHGDVIVPMTIQVNVTSIEPKRQLAVYSKLKLLFDKTLTFGAKPVPTPKKSKWKFW